MLLKPTVDVDSFKDKVYILESGSLFALYLTETHFCLASVPTLDGALDCLGNLIKRYDTYGRLLNALKECETQLSPATFTQRQFAYNKNGQKYVHLVNDIIEEYEHGKIATLKKKLLVPKKKKKKKIIKKKG